MKKKRVLIFDCDGVLRSVSWQGIFIAYQAIIRFAGKNPDNFFVTMDGFQKWINLNWHVNMVNIGGIPKEHYPQVLDIFHEVNDPLMVTFEWVERIFRELSVESEIAVLSASSSDSIRRSLSSCIHHISLVVGSDNVGSIKPDPEGIHYIMDKLGAQEAVMIGDTEQDIEAGKNAEIETGAVDWGIRRIGTFLVDLNPDYVFHSPEDLLFLKER